MCEKISERTRLLDTPLMPSTLREGRGDGGTRRTCRAERVPASPDPHVPYAHVQSRSSPPSTIAETVHKLPHTSVTRGTWLPSLVGHCVLRIRHSGARLPHRPHGPELRPAQNSAGDYRAVGVCALRRILHERDSRLEPSLGQALHGRGGLLHLPMRTSFNVPFSEPPYVLQPFSKAGGNMRSGMGSEGEEEPNRMLDSKPPQQGSFSFRKPPSLSEPFLIGALPDKSLLYRRRRPTLCHKRPAAMRPSPAPQIHGVTKNASPPQARRPIPAIQDG